MDTSQEDSSSQHSKPQTKIQFKDKQKLFSKLYITSTYTPSPNQIALIVSPVFLNLILHQLSLLSKTSSNKPLVKEYQKQLIQQILQIISSKQQNSLLIYNHDRSQQNNLVLDTIIMQLLNLIDDMEDIVRFQKYLEPLTHYYVVRLKNVTKLTQYLSKAFYAEQFNEIKMMFVIRVIRNYFSPKQGFQNLPMSFFYLFGQNCTGIKILSRQLKLADPIKNEFSFVACFRLTQTQIFSRDKLPHLAHIKTDKEEIVVLLTKNHLEIQNVMNKKRISIPFHVEIKKKYRLVVSFWPISTQVSINSNNFIVEPIIKKQSSQRQLDTITFGQAFEGQLFSLIFLAKRIEIEKDFSFAEFPLGIQKWSTLRKLSKKHPKILQKVIFGWLPFSVFESRFKMYCFDVFKKNHGEMMDNVIVMVENGREDGLEILGGFKVVVPLFYLLRFYQPMKSKQILNELLGVIEGMVERVNKQVKELHSSKQIQQHDINQYYRFPNQQSFMLLGNHLSSLSQYFTDQSFLIMFSIYCKLNDDHKLQFVKQVFWNVPIHKISDQAVIKQFYLIMIKIYQNNRSIALKVKILDDILYWIVDCFQRNQIKCLSKEDERRKKITLDNIVDLTHREEQQNYHPTTFYCCYQHYLNDFILYPSNDFSLFQARQIAENSISQHYQWLEKILSILLQYKFIENSSDLSYCIRTLLRFLMNKQSTCFYLLILKTIKRQLRNCFSSSKSIDSHKGLIKLLHSKYQILGFIQFLAQKTISLDLITQIIQFKLYFYRSNLLTEDEKRSVVRFVENTIRKLADGFSCRNPIIEGFRRQRKKSAQYSKSSTVDFNNSTQKKAQFLKHISHPNKQLISLLKSHPLSLQTYQPFYLLIQNILTGQTITFQPQTTFSSTLNLNINLNLNNNNTAFPQSFRLAKVYLESLPLISQMKVKVLKLIEANCTSQSNRNLLMENQFCLAMLYNEWRRVFLGGQQQNCQIKDNHHQKNDLHIKQGIKICLKNIFSQFVNSFVQKQMAFFHYYQTFKKVIFSQCQSRVQSTSLQQNNEEEMTISQHKLSSSLCHTQQLSQQQNISNFFHQFLIFLEQNVYQASSENQFNLLLNVQLMLILMAEKTQLNSKQKEKNTDNKLLLVGKFSIFIDKIVCGILQQILVRFSSEIVEVRGQQYMNNNNNSNSSSMRYPLAQLNFLNIEASTFVLLNKKRLNNKGNEKSSFNQQSSLNLSNFLHHFFSLQLTTMSQGEVNFIFDVMIPKLTSHFWLQYGQGLEIIKENHPQKQVQKSALLKDIIQKYLNKKTTKIVYVFELFFGEVMERIQHSVDELMKLDDNNEGLLLKVSDLRKIEQNIEQISIDLEQLLQLYNIFAIQRTCQWQKSLQQSFIGQKGSFLRLITYQTSSFLLQFTEQKLKSSTITPSNDHQQNHQITILLSSVFKQAYKKFWRNIFQLIYFRIRTTTQQVQDSDKIIDEAFDSYECLAGCIGENNKYRTTPYLIDLLRFYILDRDSYEVVSIVELKKFYYSHQNSLPTQKTHKWIHDEIFSQKFIQSITLNNQMPIILKKISSINNMQLIKKYHHQTHKKKSSLSLSSIKSIESSTSIKSQTSISSSSFQQNYSHPQQLSTEKLEKSKQQQHQKSSRQQLVQQKKQSLQKLFEHENIIQQQVRYNYQYVQQMQARKFNHTWQKLWRKLRIYHQPYGLWMAMRNSPDNFQYDNTSVKLKIQSQQIKNFIFKVSKFSSLSGIKPILEAKIIEPWHVVRDRAFGYLMRGNGLWVSCDESRFQSFQDHQKTTKKKQNSTKRESTNVQNLWKYVWKIPGLQAITSPTISSQNKKQVFNVTLINQTLKAQGRIHINANQQIQFWYLSSHQQDSHLTFQKFTLSPTQQLFKIWPIMMVRTISKRRYMMKYHALEIEFIDSIRVLIDFTDQDEDQFLGLVEKVRQRQVLGQGDKLKANKIDVFGNGWFVGLGQYYAVINQLTEQWKHREITNLTYLCKLNVLASRSGLDLSQYPVVPWILEMTPGKQPKMRDLSKTMGGLGSQQRIKSLIQKFQSKDPFNPVPAFFYGTHYSSPGVVFNFLVRIYPFSQYLKNLQGGRFDLPDRLFSSLQSSWKSAYSQISDVRQLTPEFYFLPEIFVNLEGHNFGETQNCQRIHNVELPEWAADSPYFFVMQFRQMLECEEVSQHLGQWIDLIFGYKQKGQQAQKSLNLYYYLTYQEYNNDLRQQYQDQVHIKSCQAQIVHFGQVPPQLLEKPHMKRNPAKHNSLQLRILDKYLLMNKLSENPLKIEIDQQKKRMTIIRRNEESNKFGENNQTKSIKEQQYIFVITLFIGDLFYLLQQATCKLITFTTHPYLIISGYMNNQFRLYNKYNGNLQKQYATESRILCMHLNEEENLLLIGCANGQLVVYEVEVDNNGNAGVLVELEKVFVEVFQCEVSYICQRDGWTIVVAGRYCSVYKISRAINYLSVEQQKYYKPCVQFIRSYKNNLKITYALLLTSPLYSVIIIDNASVKCYSINGQLIKTQSYTVKLEPWVMKDEEMNEYVCLVEEEDRMVVVSGPDLRAICQLEVGGEVVGVHAGGVVVREDRIQVVGW